MKNLLLLHNRMDWNSNLIWKTAISSGWETRRHVSSDDLSVLKGKYDLIRYYGNTLDASWFINPPFECYKIPSNILSEISIDFPEEFGRGCASMTYGELKNRKFSSPVFAKCAYTKWFESRVYNSEEAIGNESCKDDDYVYVQSLINPVDEYRCFVNEGQILTCSQYKRDGKLITEPEEPIAVPEFFRDVVSRVCSKYGLFYGTVFDFARLDDGRFVLLELNESWASGLYDCEPSKCFESIINSQYTL